MVNIDFEFDTQYGKYSDTLILGDDNTFTPEQIDAMKQQRLNNWLSIIESIQET